MVNKQNNLSVLTGQITRTNEKSKYRNFKGGSNMVDHNKS